jgi:hypothetical protein
MKNPSQRTITERFAEHAISGLNLADERGLESNWYKHARDQVSMAASLFNLPADYVSGVIAVTSANCSVSVNMDRAFRYLEGHEVEFAGKLTDEYTRRYASTGDPAIYSVGTSVTTDKTNEFRLNICPVHGPYNDHRVTVDRHIADGATGVTSTVLNDTLRYRCIVAVRRVSKMLGFTECHTQALIWYSVRSLKGHKDPFSFFNVGDEFAERLKFSSVG